MKAKNAIIPVIGLALTLTAGGCKKDKDSNTDLLVGEWEVVKKDGVAIPNGYTYTWEFQKDNDFSYCGGNSGFTYCINGEWDWANSDEDEVELTWDDSGDTYTASFQIDDISKDKLNGKVVTDGDTYQVELEKVK